MAVIRVDFRGKRLERDHFEDHCNNPGERLREKFLDVTQRKSISQGHRSSVNEEESLGGVWITDL